MQNMTLIFLIIIIVYLLFSFLKRRKPAADLQQQVSPSPPVEISGQALAVVELAAVAAAIAAVMGTTPYVVKRVYATAAVDEKRSTWRVAARNEAMMKRVFFK